MFIASGNQSWTYGKKKLKKKSWTYGTITYLSGTDWVQLMEAIGTLIFSWIYKNKNTVELIKDKTDVACSFFVSKKAD